MTRKPVSSLADKRNPLQGLFTATLKQVYGVEKELPDVCETLQDEATSKAVRIAMQERRNESITHLEQLEKIFLLINEEPDTEKCRVVKGLLKEANTLVDETDAHSVARDAALVFSGQKIEHYKISLYATLVQFAQALGISGAVTLLTGLLQDEKYAESLLSGLSQSLINKLAMEKPA